MACSRCAVAALRGHQFAVGACAQVGLTSGKMMELNKDAGAVATAVLGALTSGGKVSTSPIAAVYRSEPFDDPADRFSISWRLQLTNPTPQERQTLTWMTSWEMHAHCQLLRVPGPGPSGFTMTPGAAHVKPTVRQRELGVSITVPQAFMTALENASQADFVGWLHNNPTRVTGALSNFAAK